MKRALLLAAPLLLSACAMAPPPYFPPPPPPIAWGNATATIGFGGQAMLNDVTLRPLAVVEDSRCALDVQCVWAGRLILAVEIGQPGLASQRTTMTLGQPLAIAGGTLTLVAAAPPKRAGAPPASAFTFELTR